MGIQKIGYQGQTFDPSTPARVKELVTLYPNLDIEVDGGVAEATIPSLVAAGASRLVVGSAISKAPDPQSAYQKLLSLANATI